MAYAGYLLKFTGSNHSIPMGWIFEKSYKITPNRRQDLDPFRDANGLLHRNVIDHAPSTVEFQFRRPTSAMMAQFHTLLNGEYNSHPDSSIRSRERKVSLQYYVPEIDNYQTGEFYIPNLEYTIDYVHDNKIFYSAVKVEFIEY